MPIITAENLKYRTQRILEGVDTPAELADIVSNGLVEANLTGHDSHGVIRLSQYVNMVGQGRVQPAARAIVKQTWQATAVIDGAYGWGQPAAHLAAQTAIDLARTFGIGAVTIQRCNHIGRLGEYADLIAQAGLLGTVLCNSSPLVAPHGGHTRLLGTNPVAYGIPRGAGQAPVLIDFATSGVAEGKLKVARAKKKKLAAGLIVDVVGAASLEPDDFYAGGALLPMGAPLSGHKGYCLSVMCELMGGALSGNGPAASPTYRWGNGVTVMAMQISPFMPLESFLNMTDAYCQQLQAAPPASGYDAVMLPGDPERRARQERLAHGIELPQATWDDIDATAKRLRIE
ncbi:MAG: Ldh family oxidoreductase [Chloroflexota bacterium]|jgi:uncharacterized oxidoreductase|nr:Ldh family oxidoreductase [Chloroflexota bacterium]